MPDKATLFCSVARFHEKVSGGDRKLPGRPTVLNDVSVENISSTYCKTVTKISIHNKIFKYFETICSFCLLSYLV
jgi:hypothetical protein